MRVHEHRFIVRYYETDAMGVVHHSNYVRYFETARTEFLRAVGQDYKQMEADGIYCILRQLECKYIAPARFNDELYVRVWISQMTPTRLYYRYEIISGGGKRICEGETEHVFVNTSFMPVNLQKALPKTYDALLPFSTDSADITTASDE